MKKKKVKNIIKPKKSNEQEYLETLIFYSERAIDGRSGHIDILFREQADRLKSKLAALKSSK